MENKTALTLLIVTGTLLSPLFSYSQDVRTPAQKKIHIEHETLGDPYQLMPTITKKLLRHANTNTGIAMH